MEQAAHTWNSKTACDYRDISICPSITCTPPHTRTHRQQHLLVSWTRLLPQYLMYCITSMGKGGWRGGILKLSSGHPDLSRFHGSLWQHEKCTCRDAQSCKLSSLLFLFAHCLALASIPTICYVYFDFTWWVRFIVTTSVLKEKVTSIIFPWP